MLRAVVGAGLVLALYGGLGLYGLERSAGSPVAATPLAALVSGVFLFATGCWLARRRDPAATAPLSLSEPEDSRADRRWLAAAVFASLLSVGLYGTIGFQPATMLLWIASGALASRALWPGRRRSSESPGLAPMELGFLAAILLGLALLVLPYGSRVPYEISTDEIFMIDTVKEFAEGTNPNPLGLVGWWRLPATHFAVVAKIALLTGTSLEAIRFLSGITALLIVIPFYLWVRALHGRAAALVATSLLSFAHVFIGWGRIALHQNAAVLILVVALALLTTGTRDRCRLRMLWGGFALGLGFHTYPSGQIAIFIWMVALLGLLATRRASGRAFATIAAISLFGFVLCVAPIVVNAVVDFEAFTMRASAVAVTSPEVQSVLSARWAIEPGAVVKENIVRGLLAFNHPYSYVTYHNAAHGFVDPITGVLVWLGFGLAIAHLRRPGMLLAAVGLLGVYIPNLFTESAPTHGRLLIGLPFVAVLCAEAVLAGTRVLAADPDLSRRVSRWVVVAVVGVVMGLNLNAYRDYILDQQVPKNDPVTAIGRTLDVGIRTGGPLARFFGQDARWDARHHIVLIANEQEPIFDWAEPRSWHQWVAFFADSVNVHLDSDLEALVNSGERAYAQGFWNQLTVFLPTPVWERNQERLRARYPRLRHWSVTPNRRLTAFEIER